MFDIETDEGFVKYYTFLTFVLDVYAELFPSVPAENIFDDSPAENVIDIYCPLT